MGHYAHWVGLITSVVTCFSLWGNGEAQEPKHNDTISMNLAECVAQALMNNSGVKTQEIVVRQKQLKVKDAKTDLIPDLTVEGFWNPNSFEDDISEFGVNLKLSGGGLEGWRKVSQIKISNMELDLSYLVKHTKEAEVEYLTFRLYLAALLAWKEVIDQQEILELHENNLKRLRIEYADRAASLLGLQEAEEAYLNSRLMLLDAKARHESTINDLKKIMGLPIHKRIKLDPDIDEQLFRKALSLTLKEVLARSSSVAVLERRIGILEERVKFNKLGQWPTPFARGGYQVEPDPRQGSVEISEERNQWYAVVGLEWKLYDWKKTKRQIQEAWLDLEKERILLNQVKCDLEAKWFNLKAKEKHLTETRGLLLQRVSMLEKRLELSQKLFERGEVDFAEVTEVNEKLVRARLALMENHHMLVLNNLEVIYLTGELFFPPPDLQSAREMVRS